MSYIAKCSFNECSCELITINPDHLNSGKQKVIKLSKSFFNKYKLFQKNHSKHESDQNKLMNFLITESFWDFDNIGVSRSIETLKLDETDELAEDFYISYLEKEYKILTASKYLICSECDRGPVGLILSIKEKDSEDPVLSKEICILSLESVFTD
ncbi:hypothetical protein QEN19_001719 [Hanseniaspora menglaensis]